MENTKKEQKLNLYQKLVEIRKSVDYLKKEAKGYQYSYTKESQVIAALRPKMDELGVFIETDMLKPEIKNDGIVEVGFEFRIVNAESPTETIVKHLYLQDTAGDPKKIGGLLTYAHRYFLLKFFEIATDEMDIDAFQDKSLSTNVKKKEMATDKQIEALKERIGDNKAIMDYLTKNIPGEKLENLTADRLSAVNRWLDKKLSAENEE